MLKLQDISAWLVSLGVSPAPIDSLYKVSPNPQRMIVLSDGGGPGDVMERLFDRMALSVHCFGKQRQYQDGESLMSEVDQLILQAIPPVTIGGVYVNDIARIARPRFTGPDALFRAVFQASYLLQFAIND